MNPLRSAHHSCAGWRVANQLSITTASQGRWRTFAGFEWLQHGTQLLLTPHFELSHALA
jgi:hypothetical protein